MGETEAERLGYVNLNRGPRGRRMAHSIVNARTGVTRYLPGVDRPPGTVVLKRSSNDQLSGVCENVGSFWVGPSDRRDSERPARTGATRRQ